MFNDALTKTEIEIGSKNNDEFINFIKSKTKDEIGEIAVSILDKMQPTVTFLYDMVNNIFSPEIFRHSEIERIFSPRLDIEICCIRIKPNEGYYLKHHKTVPRPKNPNGPDACGIEILFSMVRGFSTPEIIVSPKIFLHFSVWGYEERKAFGTLLENYKRLFELLLAKSKVDFSTSCVFDRVDIIKTNNPFKKLIAYFEKDDDAENNFSFERFYSIGDEYDDLGNIFVAFAIMYGSCLGLLYNKKNLDKILNYFTKLNNTKN